jgi:hypothetical protein
MKKRKKNKNKNENKKNIIIILLIGVLAALLWIAFNPCVQDDPAPYDSYDWVVPTQEKPVIYLYPEQEQNVYVALDYSGEIIADYPKYNEEIKGWNVTAYPDGRLINHEDNEEYSYLFWEGILAEPVEWDFSKGFVVKGEDTKDFLQNILPQMGLSTVEYNEFIVYWFPLMQNNPYNLIHFAQEQYTDTAALTISPEPDSLLRVFMVYKALEERIEIEEQQIEPFERKGFTVVEWGGMKAE